MTEYPEGATVRVEDMGPVERAYAEAMHEGCADGPPHPLSAHSPWSGGDLDGTEPWPTFVDRLARHGLELRAAADFDVRPALYAASAILDRHYADPDDDAAIVARAVLRLAAALTRKPQARARGSR